MLGVGDVFGSEFSVVDGVVEFLPGSHSVHPVGLSAGGKEVGIEFLDRFEHYAEGGDGEDDHLVAEVIELVSGDEGGLAEFCHVSEEGDSGEGRAELFEFSF